MKKNNTKFTWREKSRLKSIYTDSRKYSDFRWNCANNMGSFAGTMEDKYALVDRITESVETFEAVTQTIRGNDAERIDELLKARFQEREEMEEVLAALEIAEKNTEAARQMSSEKADAFCREYIREHLADCTDEELAEMLKTRIFGLKLPTSSFEKLISSLENESDCLPTVTCLGRESTELKIALAVSVYCSNLGTRNELSVEEAVAAACTHIEVQAVADAVERGYMTARSAEALLKILLYAVVICFLSLYTLACFMKGYWIIGLGYVALDGIVSVSSWEDLVRESCETLGKVAAWMPGRIQNSCRNVRAGLKKITARMKQEAAGEPVQREAAQEKAEEKVSETVYAYAHEAAAAEAML